MKDYYSVIFIILLIAFLSFLFFPIRLWFRALSSGALINPFWLIRIRVQKTDPGKVIEPLVVAAQSDLEIRTKAIVSHIISGGDADKVIRALVKARNAAIPLSFKQVAAFDLAGIDILEAVSNYITPKVIKTDKITAVAGGGIELSAIAHVTLQTNFENLIGGAGEETILAKIGEGINKTIGSAESYKEVQANPNEIANQVLRDLKRLSDTGKIEKLAYDIVSLDIADVYVGKNIGAGHEADRAYADKKTAQAQAEQDEQRLKIRLLQEQANRMAAEAEIPRAIAKAIAEGKVNLMDYYRMKNMNADTDMRETIASQGKKSEEESD